MSRAAIETFQLGYYDTNPLSKLYNRLLFPIFDQYGEFAAIQGRALSDEITPKYWHTSFDKSALLYGLHETALRATILRTVVVCEGPFDVLALYDAAIPAVACLGTSLTLEQALLLRRYASNVVVWYDNDVAGLKATENAVPILKDAGFNVMVPVLRMGNDPSETWQKHGIQGIARVIYGSKRT